MKKTAAIFFSLVVLGVAAWGGWWMATNPSTISTSTILPPAPALSLNIPIATDDASSTSNRSVPQGQYEYRSTKYHFSILYPQDLTVKEYPDVGGAETIVFQNVKTVQGFQIFVLPYDEPQVTADRFRRDNPSGVKKNLENIKVDGATAAAFYSESSLLGETREVWILRSPFLYETSAPKEIEAWFGQILQTWQFI